MLLQRPLLLSILEATTPSHERQFINNNSFIAYIFLFYLALLACCYFNLLSSVDRATFMETSSDYYQFSCIHSKANNTPHHQTCSIFLPRFFILFFLPINAKQFLYFTTMYVYGDTVLV